MSSFDLCKSALDIPKVRGAFARSDSILLSRAKAIPRFVLPKLYHYALIYMVVSEEVDSP